LKKYIDTTKTITPLGLLSFLNIIVGIFIIPAFINKFGLDFFTLHIFILGLVNFQGFFGLGFERLQKKDWFNIRNKPKPENLILINSFSFLFLNTLVSIFLVYIVNENFNYFLPLFITSLFLLNAISTLLKNIFEIEGKVWLISIMAFVVTQIPIFLPLALLYILDANNADLFILYSSLIRVILSAVFIVIFFRKIKRSNAEYLSIKNIKFLNFNYENLLVFYRSSYYTFIENIDKLIVFFFPIFLPFYVLSSFVEKTLIPARIIASSIISGMYGKKLDPKPFILVFLLALIMFPLFGVYFFDYINEIIYQSQLEFDWFFITFFYALSIGAILTLTLTNFVDLGVYVLNYTFLLIDLILRACAVILGFFGFLSFENLTLFILICQVTTIAIIFRHLFFFFSKFQHD